MVAHQPQRVISPASTRLPGRDVALALRASARTAVFFLKVLPMLPSRPVDWVTHTPVVERVRYPGLEGMVEAELYRPAGKGPHPGMVVCLGVVPFGVDHPQVPRLGMALARAGFATLLFWSSAMRDLRLEPEDSQRIAMAYRWLIEQPFINPGRSGLLGTCVGGSFALLAAAEPSIRDRVGFVVAWAPYSSLRTLAHDVATATAGFGGVTRPWVVDQLTRRVFVRSLTGVLAADEAERLRSACAERDGRIERTGLSVDGRAVAPLLMTLTADEADCALSQLPVAMQARLDAMSPMTRVGGIEAPLLVLAHDRDDAVIPIGESQRLVAALAGRSGVRYTEFTMFKHLDPTKVKLPPVALARELVKFVVSVYPLFRQAVEPARGDPHKNVTRARPSA
jgi:hypothetical protein